MNVLGHSDRHFIIKQLFLPMHNAFASKLKSDRINKTYFIVLIFKLNGKVVLCTRITHNIQKQICL